MSQRRDPGFFHHQTTTPPDGVSRRDVLKTLTGASAALALGVMGCERKPRRQIVSRVTGPEYQKPGKALYYASTHTEGPFPYGMLIKTVDGRPVKIEGNPDHPVNLGTTTASMQALVPSLYDPDRLREPRHGEEAISWDAVDRQVVEALRSASTVVLITRSTLGPAERALVEKFRTAAPGAKHFVHEAVHDGPRRRAWTKLYGADGELVPRFDRARVIVSLDSDFLGTDGAVLANVRAHTQGRKLDDAEHRRTEINRLYAIESAMTITGSNADHRIRLRPSAMEALARALRQAVDGNGDALRELAATHRLDARLLAALAQDLRAHRGRAVVVAGPHLPESVHAAVALLNDQLEAPGRTLDWNPAPASLPVSDPQEVEATLEAGADVVICLGVNPVYDAPGANFAALVGKARLSVGHGLYRDETASACTLALPSSHNLESWNDAAPRAGLETLCQPVIAPLFDSRQEAESLLKWTQALAPEDDPIRRFEDWHGFLQARWQEQLVSADATAWEESLRVGCRIREETAAFPAIDRAAAGAPAREDAALGAYEVVILPHSAIYDGRFANNAWLQELPDPTSKLVWDNATSLSPRTAATLGAAEGELVAIRVGDRSVELPVLIQPGTTEGVVAVTLGHGRRRGGLVMQQAGGTNVAPLLGREDAATPRLAVHAQLRKARGARPLVRTQKEFSTHDRPIVLDGTLAEYRHEADFVKHKRHLPEPVDLYEPYDYSKGHKWAMAIDLDSCIGCNGCSIACQAENNIPTVGRERCSDGREMHWIRIDRYHEGDPDNPTVHNLPMLCQHCDNAPC
ncbi:MAG: twin-arginine translocation signal domain-containing protein, partial [bacterium]|nr:twin-arginine translocation signal domain-containing protein [bacterium]